MSFGFEIAGSMVAALARKSRAVPGALMSSARAFSILADDRLEADTASGFSDGERISKVWDHVVFPLAPVESASPAVYLSVDKNFNHVVDAFATAATITSKTGGWLIVPTFWAIRDGLKPDNEPQRGPKGRFVARDKGRDWYSAAVRRYGELGFVPHKDGNGGWLAPRKRSGDRFVPVFRVMRRTRLKKRIDYQSVFQDLRQEFPAYMAREIGERLP